jgi:hypothetical protein
MALQSKLIAAIILWSLLFFSCDSPQADSTHVMVIIDITIEDVALLPDAKNIVSGISRLHKTPEDAITISFGYLDDLSGASFTTKSLEPGDTNAATANPVKRKNEVKRFYEDFENTISSELTGLSLSKAQSKIYMKTCKSLAKLTAAPESNKYLIIYSDFLENSEFTSFYRDAELNKAQSNPTDYYETKLKAACSMPDLSDVTIYMNVFRDPATDVRINKAEKFWIQLFKSQGAEVRIDEF